MNWMDGIFSLVCGQFHCWSPGGVSMPVCERCLGLYVGGLWGLALVVCLRASPTRVMLWLHGMAMLVMLPFGYHFVPQGPIVRTATGFLFGVGMVYYLALTPAEVLHLERLTKARPSLPYAFVAFMPLPLILLAANYGSVLAGLLLALLAVAGLAVTSLLVLTNAAAVSYGLIARQKAAA